MTKVMNFDEYVNNLNTMNLNEGLLSKITDGIKEFTEDPKKFLNKSFLKKAKDKLSSLNIEDSKDIKTRMVFDNVNIDDLVSSMEKYNNEDTITKIFNLVKTAYKDHPKQYKQTNGKRCTDFDLFLKFYEIKNKILEKEFGKVSDPDKMALMVIANTLAKLFVEEKGMPKSEKANSSGSSYSSSSSADDITMFAATAAAMSLL